MSEENVNLARIGGTLQSGADVIDTGTSSVKVKIVAGASGGGAVTVADGADVAQGAKADAAWVAGDGTVISLLKKIASAGGGAASIADGADVNAGATADAAVVSDANGTLSSKLRGLVKMLADVWDSVNHRLNVSIAAALPAGSAIIGKVAIDQTTPGTTNAVQANAGTNLNTSLLALEAGGNLATAATQLTTLLGLLLAQGAAATSVTGPIVQARVADAPESYLDGYVQPLSLTTEGRLRVSSSPAFADEDMWGSFDYPIPGEDFFANLFAFN